MCGAVITLIAGFVGAQGGAYQSNRMINQSHHLIHVTCDCARCVERHWGVHTAKYTMPSKEQCISVLKQHGWLFDDDKHYAPGHLEKYGRHVSEWDKQVRND